MKKNELNKFYNQYKLYLFPIVTTIGSLILVIFIFNQVSGWLGGAQNQAVLLSRFKILDAKAVELQSLDEVDLSQKLKLALSVFPEDKDFANIIGLLQEIAYQKGFTIASLQVGQGREEQGSSGFNVRLELSGNKAALGDLLKGVENASRLMRVNSLDLSISSGDNINTMLTINVLYAPIPKTIGSVDAPLPVLSAKDQQVLATLASQVGLPQVTGPSQPPITTLPPRGKENPFQ